MGPVCLPLNGDGLLLFFLSAYTSMPENGDCRKVGAAIRTISSDKAQCKLYIS